MPTQTDITEAERLEIIDRIYDAVLHPEKSNDFVAAWDRYISRLSQEHDDLRNAADPSEGLADHSGLENHFARAYALLEQIGRGAPQDRTQLAQDQTGEIARLDSEGRLLSQSPSALDSFGIIHSARDITPFLSTDGAAAWESFVRVTRRAPAPDVLHVFARADGGNLVAYTRRDPVEGGVHIVVKTLAITWTAALETALANRFGLSKGELRLARALCEWGSLDAVAQRTQRSKNTLRSQLKSIFNKLNAGGQPEVLQIIAMLAHLTSYVGLGDDTAPHAPHLGEELRVTMPDGTVVPVHCIGPADGTPVVFIHGMLDGVAVNARLLQVLHRQGLRFIAPVRPNFGAGSILDRIEDVVSVFLDQLDCVLDHLEQDRFWLLGHLAGAPFAFAAAQRFGERVSGIVNVSGGVPILSARQFSNMGRRQKAFAYTTRFAPTLLPALLRIGVAQVDSLDIEGLMRDMYPAGSPDRQALQDAELATLVLDGYRFAVRQGARGFEGDARLVTRDWSELLPAADLPVLLIHSHHDPASEFAHAKAFADRQGYAFHAVAEQGQLVLYSHPDTVLKRLRSFIDEHSG